MVGLVAGLLGRVWWVFDLTANYRPHLGIALLVVAVPALWIDHEAGVLGLLAGVVGVAGLLPLLVGTHPVPAANAETMEIVSFNVSISNPNRSDVADFIAAEDPDVVFLFESSVEWEDALRRAELPLTIITVVPRTRLAGVTILARPDLQPTAVEVDAGREVAAVSVHLDGQVVDVVGVHPPSPTSGVRSRRRDDLLAKVAAWVVTRPGPVVVVGDLNATPWSSTYRSFRWRTGLTDTLAGEGYQASWPTDWDLVAIPIDHVLHSPDLGSTGRRLGPALGSAHRPVIVEVGAAER